MTQSAFEKDRLRHGQRLMSVAVAAMVMTVSATVVRSFRVAQAKGRMDIGPRYSLVFVVRTCAGF